MAFQKTKLFTCLLTLTLLVSCAPSFITPTPVPPLDANSIQLFIAQTADAASTQTLVALPTFTATPTVTPTPRNTFTPEPSFTPIATFFYPTPTPAQRVLLYRLKHDHQLSMYNFKSRTFDGNSEGLHRQAPEIVPLYLEPKLTSGTGRTTMNGAWELVINHLNNNDDRKLRYLKSAGTALFNTAGFPQMESLTMGGNIVTLESIRGDWAIVRTLNYAEPPNTDTVNYFTRPDLVHKFVVVGWRRSNRTTVIVKPPRGDLYYPFVSRSTVWVQMERLEPFPILPMDITMHEDVYVQPEPGPTIQETRHKLLEGASARLIAYHPTGSNVWGRLQSGGWIPLLIYPKYYTSWSMATMPPPP